MSLKDIPPSKLFAIDGLGALLSAFLLGVVLVKFESVFGMPKHVLFWLAIPPCFFALYDLICYFAVKEKWIPFLKGIAVMNILYCIASAGLMYSQADYLKPLGYAYFIGEIIIVLALAFYELKVARIDV